MTYAKINEVCEMPNLTTCLKLAGSKVFRKAKNGLKGIAGGRQTRKNDWDAWMFAHRLELIETAERERTVDHLIPSDWKSPGDSHLHVWHAEDFAEQCRELGFKTTIGWGTIHGPRFGRDFRAVGRVARCGGAMSRPPLLTPSKRCLRSAANGAVIPRR